MRLTGVCVGEEERGNGDHFKHSGNQTKAVMNTVSKSTKLGRKSHCPPLTLSRGRCAS